MKNEELINEVLKSAVVEGNKKFLDCDKAVEIAKKYTVKPIEVGKICNARKIKLRKCQLGCF